MDKNSSHKYGLAALSVVILAVSCLYLVRPILDADFFWHLKTGEWIWEHKELPGADPFSFTSPSAVNVRMHFILTSYWLSQLLYHAFHSAAGMPGIMALRFLLVGALAYFLIKRQHGSNTLYAALMMLFLVLLLDLFPVERPQFFSFLFFAVLLYLFEQLKTDEASLSRTTVVISIVLLMLIWANVHAGALLGQAAIVLLIIMEGVKFIHRSLKPMHRKRYFTLVAAGVTGLLFSLVNPNSYHAAEAFLSTGTLHLLTNAEFLPSYEVFSKGGYAVIIYWFILAATVAGIIFDPKRIDVADVALLAGVGYFSFFQVRYIPFFMIASLPIVSRSFSKDHLLSWSTGGTLLAAFFAVVLFAGNEISNLETLRSGKWIDERRYPVSATEFVIANNLKGRMYNDYNWGGFLIWRLAPERKVFIDGRFMDERIYWQWLSIDIAYEGTGMPYWEKLLENYGVTYMILPVSGPGSPRSPLLNAVQRHKKWAPVYSDATTVIFAKRIPENRELINRSAIAAVPSL